MSSDLNQKFNSIIVSVIKQTQLIIKGTELTLTDIQIANPIVILISDYLIEFPI
jgi:hypothetical protein